MSSVSEFSSSPLPQAAAPPGAPGLQLPRDLLLSFPSVIKPVLNRWTIIRSVVLWLHSMPQEQENEIWLAAEGCVFLSVLNE